MNLKSLLRKHGVNPGVAARICREARIGMKEGLSEYEASVAAVREHMVELEGRQDEIVKMVRASGGKRDKHGS